MLETILRPFYQKIVVDPVAQKIASHLKPNQITLLGLVIGCAALPALWLHQNILSCILLLISGYLDTLDGTLARLTKTISIKGSVLDIICDRVVEVAIILGLFSIDPTHRGWPTLGMLASILICVTSFLVVGIFTKNHSGKSFYYSPGLIERAEAFIFFITIILLPRFFIGLAIAFIVLVLLTAFLRIMQFYQQETIEQLTK